MRNFNDILQIAGHAIEQALTGTRTKKNKKKTLVLEFPVSSTNRADCQQSELHMPCLEKIPSRPWTLK